MKQQFQHSTDNVLKITRQLLDELLICPSQPLVPSITQDIKLHEIFGFTDFSQDSRPFHQGFIVHRPTKDYQRIQEGFMRTIAIFKDSSLESAERMLESRTGACEILYCTQVIATMQ